jgi:tRNA(fMet)-specific endonuclease VapC
MVKFVLDTDYVSLILRGNAQVQERVEHEPKVQITVITFQEFFNGWITRINQAKPNDDFVELYTRLYQTIDYLKQTEILNFDQEADRCFRSLLQQNPALRKARLQKDMRIAARCEADTARVALTQNATVVTLNQRDFGQVPGLQIVDWTATNL